MQDTARKSEFLGVHDRSLDAKHRVVLPAAFRPFLDEGLWLTVGQDECVMALTRDRWHALTDELDTYDEYELDQRHQHRLTTSHAARMDPDSQGRIAVPEKLRTVAGLPPQGDVVVVGRLRHFEVWNPERYRAWEREAVRVGTHRTTAVRPAPLVTQGATTERPPS